MEPVQVRGGSAQGVGASTWAACRRVGARRLAGLRTTAALLAGEARQLAPGRVASRVRNAPPRRWAIAGLSLLAVVAVLVVGNVPFGSSTGAVLPAKMPPGLLLEGLVYGAFDSLAAIGLVLIYRAGRYVNFAQGASGAVGLVLSAKLMQLFLLNYFVAALCGVVAAALLAVIVELLVFQAMRIFSAPRLIATVATLALVQLFGYVQAMVTGIRAKEFFGLIPSPTAPIPVHFSIGLVPFSGRDVIVFLVVPVVVVALALFLRLTDFGAAIQAAAENADRARLVGITVRRMHTYIWGIAGALSGLTALLSEPFLHITQGANSGPALFLFALAPAVLGGMNSLPQTFVAALGLGMVQSIVVWNFGSGALYITVLAVLLAGLVLRRRSTSRTTEGEERSFAVASRVREFPRELARLPLVRAWRVVFRVALLALAVVLPIGFDLQRQILAENVVAFVIAGISLILLTGFSGQVSFGQFALVGFGALFGGWLVTGAGLDFWTGMLVATVGTGLAAAVIGVPALRIRGLFLGAVTLAFALASADYFFADSAHFPILHMSTAVQRPTLPFGWDLGTHPERAGNELHFYWFCLAVMVLVMAVVRNLRHTRWGRSFLAVRDNERAAAAYGVAPTQAKLLAFAVSGMIAGLAGYLFLFSEQQVDAASFPVTTSLVLFSAVVIGGLGSMSGAVIGALFFEGIQYFVKVDALQQLTTGVGLIVVLAFLPGGLGSLFFSTRDALLRLLARRLGILVPSLVADRRVAMETTLTGTPLSKPQPAGVEAVQ